MTSRIIRLSAASLAMAALLALFLPGAVLAATIEVHPGDDVVAAIEGAGFGDTVLVYPGTYDVTETIDITANSVTVTSPDPGSSTKPVIRGDGTFGIILYIDADNVTIDGLEVTNGTGDLISQADTTGYDPDPSPHFGTTISNCYIHGSTGDEGIELKQCTNGVITCNKVWDVAQDGIAVADNSSNCQILNNEIYGSNSINAAIYIYTSSSVTVKGNYIHNTTAANGIQMYENGGGTHTISHNRILHNTWQGGSSIDEADGNTITIYKPTASSTYQVEHNTLDDNTGSSGAVSTGHGVYANDLNGTGFVTNVRDNIISNHGGYGIRTSPTYGATVNYGYNFLYANASGPTDGTPTEAPPGSNNISDDPLLLADGSLQSGSPCIGAASDGGDVGVDFAECECDTGGSGSGGGGGCFIATAAYGSRFNPDVETLRDFRDAYLITDPAGSGFVSLYYRLSPPVAEFIDDQPALKAAVRIGLAPAVAVSAAAVGSTWAAKSAVAVSVLFVSILSLVWLRRRSIVNHRRPDVGGAAQ